MQEVNRGGQGEDPRWIQIQLTFTQNDMFTWSWVDVKCFCLTPSTALGLGSAIDEGILLRFWKCSNKKAFVQI